VEVIEDLTAEYERLDAILTGLDDAAWAAQSAAPGWSVADVVLHLAQTEEAVVASVTGVGRDGPGVAGATSIDELMELLVRAERAPGPVVLDRWRTARHACVAALRSADPDTAFPWAAAPLKPKALATTRIAEHWAHGLDITGPLGIPFPDTARLRHVAWLGHRSLPYAFSLAGEQPHEVFCQLEGPDGSTWELGPPDADSTITGPVGAFARVGAHRLAPEDSGLTVTGPYGPLALRVLRNYAS
jgi:uncharacterized protein (TIGR03084 family)